MSIDTALFSDRTSASPRRTAATYSSAAHLDEQNLPISTSTLSIIASIPRADDLDQLWRPPAPRRRRQS